MNFIKSSNKSSKSLNLNEFLKNKRSDADKIEKVKKQRINKFFKNSKTIT